MSSPQIVWLRRDLRMADQAAPRAVHAGKSSGLVDIVRGAHSVMVGFAGQCRPSALEDLPEELDVFVSIIKDYEEKISGKVKIFLRNNRDFEKENVDKFRQEMTDIGAENPTLIAFGNETYDILKRNFNDEFVILKVPHYANYLGKEDYRLQVRKSLNTDTIKVEGVFDEKSFLKIIANSKVGEKYFFNMETEIPKVLIDFAKVMSNNRKGT